MAAPAPRLLGPPEVRLQPAPAPTMESAPATGDPFIDLLTAKFNSAVARPKMGLTENLSPTFLSSGDPCLDFFFQVVPDTPPETLTGLLGAAWEQNPLTALKLVCHLRGVRGTGKSDREGFYAAALWLHGHHPKTLALNARAFAEFGYLKDLLEILHRLLYGGDVRKVAKEERTRMRRQRLLEREMLRLVLRRRRALLLRQLYNRPSLLFGDDALRAPHDHVSAVDLHPLHGEPLQQRTLRGVVLLRRDAFGVEQFLRKKERDPPDQEQGSRTGIVCLYMRRTQIPFFSSFRRSGFYLQEEQPVSDETRRLWVGGGGDEGVEEVGAEGGDLAVGGDAFSLEADQVEDAVERLLLPLEVVGLALGELLLRTVVLVPLRRALELPEVYMSAQQWGVLPYERVASVAMKTHKKLFRKHDPARFGDFLSKVREGKAKIAAGALLPHEVLAEAARGEEDEVAELQWERLVRDLSGKGKLRNCIAVCDVSWSMDGTPMDVCVALGLLVSELSDEPWGGKVITFSHEPQLHRIEGETIREKMLFVKEMDWGMNTDFQKVFDQILRVAVEGKLPEDKMVRRVFVFSDMEFDQASTNSWETDYEAIRRKFGENGYGSAVPEIVFWNLRSSQSVPVVAGQKGVALASGFSKNLMTMFLEGAEVVSPQKVMEAAISGKEYEKLVVFD